jgi:hypothetical protein
MHVFSVLLGILWGGIAHSAFSRSALIQTQIAAKPDELGFWEWFRSTGLKTVIIFALKFFSQRYFSISSNSGNIIDPWTSGCSKTPKMDRSSTID